MFFKTLLFIYLILGVSFSNASTSPPARSCKKLLSNSTYSPEALAQLSDNKFRTDRSFGFYKRTFTDLDDVLKDLDAKPHSHWIDLGAGQGIALAEYFALFASENSNLKVTGIVFQAEEFRANYIWPEDNIIMLKDRLFEDIPSDEIPKADVITDFFGVLSYAPDFGFNLAKTLSLLKPQGVLYIENGPIFEDPRTTFLFNSKTYHLAWFLKSIPNLQVTVIRSPDSLGQGLKIELLENFNPEDIPVLRLKSIETNTPPLRIYDVIKLKKS